VARGWSDEQVRALVEYLRESVYKAPADGG
jgi:hypothetical protein